MSNILITSGIISVVISATISFFTFYIKFRYEKNRIYQELSLKKLEKAINPILFEFRINNDNFEITENVINIIKTEGHLLNLEINNLFVKLVELQSKMVLSKDETSLIRFREEYSAIKKYIIDLLYKEQLDLMKVFDSDFEKHKHYKSLDFFDGFSNRFIKISEIVTMISIVLFIILAFIVVYAKKPEFSDMKLSYFIFITLIGFIYIPTLGIGLPRILYKYFDPIIYVIAKSKNFEGHGNIVKKTGVYGCKICEKKVKHFKDTKFEYCFHENVKNPTKFFSKYYWKFENTDKEN